MATRLGYLEEYVYQVLGDHIETDNARRRSAKAGAVAIDSERRSRRLQQMEESKRAERAYADSIPAGISENKRAELMADWRQMRRRQIRAQDAEDDLAPDPDEKLDKPPVAMTIAGAADVAAASGMNRDEYTELVKKALEMGLTVEQIHRGIQLGHRSATQIWMDPTLEDHESTQPLPTSNPPHTQPQIATSTIPSSAGTITGAPASAGRCWRRFGWWCWRRFGWWCWRRFGWWCWRRFGWWCWRRCGWWWCG